MSLVEMHFARQGYICKPAKATLMKNIRILITAIFVSTFLPALSPRTSAQVASPRDMGMVPPGVARAILQEQYAALEAQSGASRTTTTYERLQAFSGYNYLDSMYGAPNFPFGIGDSSFFKYSGGVRGSVFDYQLLTYDVPYFIGPVANTSPIDYCLEIIPETQFGYLNISTTPYPFVKRGMNPDSIYEFHSTTGFPSVFAFTDIISASYMDNTICTGEADNANPSFPCSSDYLYDLGFDASNNVVWMRTQRHVLPAWDSDLFDVYKYNAANKIISDSTSFWGSAGWGPLQKETYSYDAAK